MKHVCKKIATLTMAMVLGLSLVACGGEKDEKVTKKEKTDYTLSEYTKKDDVQIWYIGSIGKDAEYRAIIFKDGKCTVVRHEVTSLSKYPTLGDVAQATDAEIYDALLEAYQTYVNDTAAEYRNIEEQKEAYNWEEFGETAKVLENKDVSDFTYYDYMFSVVTDNTGNNTEEEMFTYYVDDIYFYGRGVQCGDDIKPYSTVQGQVYDSYYKGFSMYVDNGDSSGDRPFFTRVSSPEITISVDTPATEGLIVDKSESEIRDMYKEKLGITE